MERKAATSLLWTGIAVLVVLILYLVSKDSINAIPTLDESVKAQWGQVENQYQRRADLIPNLVETVRGYAGHEEETLTAIVEARAKVAQMTMTMPQDIVSNPDAFRAFERNQAMLSQALARLLVVVERYPDLKANQNFLTLQSQLEGTENRIAVARRDYIEVVQQYNIELRTILGRWVAAVFYPDATVKVTFSAAAGSQEVPRVRFGG